MENNKIGILDPDGINLNPLNNQPYSDKYKEIANKWRNYPAYEKASDIIKKIQKHQVILVISATGSGKTVLLPKYALHAFNYDAKIAVTLPKQIIAKSAAEFAALTLDVELGNQVGYKYKGSDKKFYKDTNKLLYATDGSIVAQLLQDPLLMKYNAVIIDEAHERKIQIDFLLYLLRETINKRPDFKLIIMSATIDQTIFSNYFKGFDFITIDVGGKRGYPIKSIYLEYPIDRSKYLDKGFEIIEKIIANKKEEQNDETPKDIIFFVPSIKETFEICRKMKDNVDDYCIEVYAGMDNEKQTIAQDKDMFKSAFNKKRKIVVATNVAESSLTIDGLGYVIDSGFEVSEYFDPKIGSRVLEKKLITKAQVNQRMGRTGRTAPGVCYHLYTEEEFNSMNDFPEPAIHTSNIYGECLKLLDLEMVQTVDKLMEVLNNFIEPPANKYVNFAKNTLLKLGLIDGTKITPLGKIIANMELDPEQSLAVYASYQLSCANEVMAILSIIEASKGNIGELFIKPNENSGLKKKYDEAKKKLSNKSGDHLTLLKIFLQFSKLKKEGTPEKLNDWLYKSFLKRDPLERAYKYYKKIIYKIKDDIKKLEIPKKIENVNQIDLKNRILASFYYGYRLNYAYLNKKGKYNSSLIDNIIIGNDSFITQFDTNKKEILYNDLLTMSGRTNMLIISGISKEIQEIVKNI